MFSRTATLFATTALVTLFAPCAEAQKRNDSVSTRNNPATHGSASKQPGRARTEASRAPSMLGATAPTDEHIEVTGHSYGDGVTRRAFGGGLMVNQDSPKSVSEITRDFIAKQNPALNPMQLIALLPGANVSDTDPLGMTGGNLSVRGLTESQMGFTLEGFPINDIGNFAVYPQEIVDAENLKTVRLAQGSADLDSPHISASGGVVDMYMIDPKFRPGGMVDMTYGSFNATRGFLRLDTGRIGATNLRAYFSYSQSRQDHWRGPGWDNKKHGEMKIVNDWGDGNRVSLAVVGNNIQNNAYPNASLASWKKWGTGFINPVGGSGLAAGDPPNTVYDAHYYTPTRPGSVNYYKTRPNPFTNIYASMPSTFKLNDHLTLTETPYFWYGYGNGGGAQYTDMSRFTYGTQTLSGTVNGQGGTGMRVLYNPSLTETYRPGATTKLTLTTGINRLMIGYWFEYAKQRQTAPYSFVGPDGTPLSQWGDENNVILSNGAKAQYRNTFTQTQVHTPFIGDSLSLLHDKLTIDAGLKYSIVKRNGTNYLPDVRNKYVSTNYNQALPTAAIRYKIDNRNQVFVSVATNFRMPQNYALYDAGSFNQKTGLYSTLANPDQKAEISISEEAGWRYQGDLISSSLTYFHYNFTNRLYTQSVQDQASGAFYSTNINAGGMHSDGFDAEIGTRPIHNFRPYVSVEYLHAVTDSNLPAGSGSGADYVRSAGKRAPQAPDWQVGFGLDYDDGTRFANFNLKYVARQYATFMNDQSIPGYVRMNVGVGYRFPKVGIFKRPILRLNLQNISNNQYLSWIQSPQTNANPTIGVFGNTIGGSTPTYKIASPFAAIATLTSEF
ncbi:TonB-dependent receptor [Swaminathania salitolerans]|uniref:TonB-dependent receptor n=1 Tax=Swaminathania salitolerans TaxID=182838 RepID=A0A511BNR8_9PROT|nr:TonB-dependent receptor [Swaminathania salitolerans]GEL01712.1 TonB-dependent receptor [Swaminathania salitolerans]